MKFTKNTLKRTLAYLLNLKTPEEWSLINKEKERLEEENEKLKEENNKLAEKNHYLSHTTKHLTGATFGLETRTHLYHYIEKDFLEYKLCKLTGKDTSNLEKEIKSYIKDIPSISIVAPREIHRSFGMEGGTLNITHSGVRIKEMNIKDAKRTAYINNFLRSTIPEIVLFGDAFDNYYVEENFPGEKLVSYTLANDLVIKNVAPFDIILKYLNYSIDLSKLRPDIEYTKEDYSKKTSEILSLFISDYGADFDSSNFFRCLGGILESHSSVPWWDRSVSNAKFSGDALKIVDFGKSNILVNPVYDCTQIAYGYGDRIGEIKGIAKEKLKLENFEELWEISTLYFFTRQIYNLNREIEKNPSLQRINNHIRVSYSNLLASQEFKLYDEGNFIVDSLRKNLK